MRKLAAVLLLLTLSGVAAAATITIDNPNLTTATVTFQWLEGGRIYGPYQIAPNATETFEVEAGTYDIIVDNGNGDSYVLSNEQIGEQDAGFFHQVKD